MATRILLIRRLLLVGLGLILLRLGQLQVLHGSTYRRMAEQNRLRLVPQRAPRGLMLDRVGRRLATNRAMFQVAAVPQDLPASRSSGQAGASDRAMLFAQLSPLVDLPPRELEKRFLEHQGLPFLPATLARGIPKAVALRIEEARLALPGVVVEAVSTRHYPLGSVAAHLLGYVSQPSPEIFPTLKRYGVKPQDLVGRAGLEEELESYLRGRSGGSLIEVDSRARQVRVMGRREPVPGQPVELTIDARLQGLIERQFGEALGACVVLQPQTGEVLAIASRPTFEPEVFATQDLVAIRGLLANPRAPLMNRATNGLYIPGSIAKLVTMMTALEQGIIRPDTPIACSGFVTIGDRRFHCWNRDGHGTLTLREGLMVSCNVYFMEVGRRLGLHRLRSGFVSVGFGRPTGWPLDERSGHLPFGRRLSEGEVALLAMGQGEILITPLQAAVMVSAIANQGWLVEPWVIKRIGEHAVARSHVVSVGWSSENLAMARDGMLAVVNDPQGTGVRAHSDQVRIAGKTGTAQTHLPGHPHGWFVGFCPAEEPKAAMAIVAEHGGSGGELPSAMAKMICEYIVTQPI